MLFMLSRGLKQRKLSLNPTVTLKLFCPLSLPSFLGVCGFATFLRSSVNISKGGLLLDPCPVLAKPADLNQPNEGPGTTSPSGICTTLVPVGADSEL